MKGYFLKLIDTNEPSNIFLKNNNQLFIGNFVKERTNIGNNTFQNKLLVLCILH